MASFGELLAELRKDKGLKQKALAKALHVSSATISNYENNVHLPDVDKLTSIADYFDVTLDYLLGRSSENISSSALNEQILGDKTAGELILIIKNMAPDQKKVLSSIINDMALRQFVEERLNKRK